MAKAKTPLVPPTEEELLRIVAEAGGDGITAAKLIPRKELKDQRTQLLQPLVDRKLIENKGPASTPKYVITEEGYDELARHDPSYRVERERKKREAKQEALITDLSTLQQKHAQAIEGLQTLHETLLDDYKQLGDDDDETSRERSAVQQELDAARKAYDNALSSIQDQANFLPFAQRLKKAIVSAIPDINRDLVQLKGKIDSFPAKIDQLRQENTEHGTELERRLSEIQRLSESSDLSSVDEVSQLRLKIDSLNETIEKISHEKDSQKAKFEKRINELQTKAPTAPATIDRDEVWKTTKREYDRIRSLDRFSTTVKLPELTDAVIAKHPKLTVPMYHNYLLEWNDNLRLHLGVINKPSDDPRYHDGIKTDSGWLFKVSMD